MIADTVGFQLGDMTVGTRTREAIELAVRHGRLARASAAASNLGAFSFYAGSWDEALTQWIDARSTAFAAGDVVGGAQVGLMLAELYVNRGELDEGDAVLADSVRQLRTAGQHSLAAYGLIHQARGLLARGRVDAAERLAEEVEIELATLGMRMTALEAALVRVEAVTLEGRPDEALDLLAASTEAARGEIVALMPRVHLERGRAQLARGAVEAASAEVGQGLGLARDFGLPYEEARLLLVQSAIAAARDDVAAAAAASAEADAILQGLGAVGT
jgi:ATP/maltotriose-dependent transcriptional regulator MalT